METSDIQNTQDYIKKHGLDLNDLRIKIDEYTADEDKTLLFKIIEKNSSNMKSLKVFDRRQQRALTKDQAISIYRSVSTCSRLQNLELYGIPNIGEDDDSCNDPVMDLQNHTQLEVLDFWQLSFKGLLLPVNGTKFRHFNLNNVTMDHHSLAEVLKWLPSVTTLKELHFAILACGEHNNGCNVMVLDLQKHTQLEVLDVWELSFKGLLLPVNGTKFRHLNLNTVTMDHHSLAEVLKWLPSLTSLQELRLARLACSEHSDSCGQFALDLQKHDKLESLMLKELSLNGLVLPAEGMKFRHLDLCKIKMAHDNLEQLYECLSSRPGQALVMTSEIKCCEHIDDNCPSILKMKELYRRWLIK